MSLKAALSRTKALLTPRSSTDTVPQTEQRRGSHGFHRAPTESSLFPPVDDDCDHDCTTCSVHYPRSFKIDETEQLYGHVNGWGAHLVVATGKNDWVRDVADEKGSVMEAVRDVMVAQGEGKKGKGWDLMLSASNMPTPDDEGTRVLLLPSWVVVERVRPDTTRELIERYVDGGVSNTSPLVKGDHGVEGEEGAAVEEIEQTTANLENGGTNSQDHPPSQQGGEPSQSPIVLAQPSPFETRPCPHNYLILLCSHRTRDARCGQSAPLLRKEFERQLRPLGLYRDLHDERPGGVGIYFINHVGGHKFSANVMVYRRAVKADGTMGEASQCIWLARVRPEDCEGIVKFTLLQGKVVKPQRQLRGGFDREKGLVSW